jgi:hypothetical protein
MDWSGPLAFPRNLERAIAQAHGWEGVGEVSQRHRAFVRIKSNDTLGGANVNGPILL